MNGSLVDSALELAFNGWPVFPCRWSGTEAKAPLTKNGFYDAVTDEETIRRWWRQWPEAMIGGRIPESVLVFDIDPRNGGSYEALCGCLGQLPETLTSWSGRGDGGRHLFYFRPYERISSQNLPPGIDLKLTGYVILPPSIHPSSGMPYSWELGDVVKLPAAALRSLLPAPAPFVEPPVMQSGDGSHLVNWLDKFPDHGINGALFWASCRAAEGGLIDRIREDLIARAVALGSPESAARATVGSAERRVLLGGLR